MKSILIRNGFDKKFRKTSATIKANLNDVMTGTALEQKDVRALKPESKSLNDVGGVARSISGGRDFDIDEFTANRPSHRLVGWMELLFGCS